MMRSAQLEERRRMLLTRCEAQRVQLAQRVAQLHHQSRPAGIPAGSGSGAASPERHPLAWIGALGAMMLLGRTRQVLKLLMWARTALTVASRTAHMVRMVRDLGGRRPRSASRPARR